MGAEKKFHPTPHRCANWRVARTALLFIDYRLFEQSEYSQTLHCQKALGAAEIRLVSDWQTRLLMLVAHCNADHAFSDRMLSCCCCAVTPAAAAAMRAVAAAASDGRLAVATVLTYEELAEQASDDAENVLFTPAVATSFLRSVVDDWRLSRVCGFGRARSRRLG